VIENHDELARVLMTGSLGGKARIVREAYLFDSTQKHRPLPLFFKQR
jgi:hypothetical protein